MSKVVLKARFNITLRYFSVVGYFFFFFFIKIILFSQPNTDRRPAEEMLAAEQSGRFVATDGPCTGVPGASLNETSEQLANRLQDLGINQSTTASKSNVAEKLTKPRSTSRPLTMDEDDLELDLDLDENIDTTVCIASS